MPIVKKVTPQTICGEERHISRDFSGLVEQLQGPNPVARRWAARDLADFSNASGVLLNRLVDERDIGVRQAILSALTQLGDSIAVAGLVACLRSEDVALRNAAIESMQALPDAVAPVMDGLLHDSDSDIRIFAVNILESLRHPKVEAWLIAVIEDDAHINVCAAAVDILNEVGSVAAREALLRLQARFPSEPYIRFATGLALKRIEDGAG